MHSDSTDDTRKLSMTVDTPDDIDATYNPTITYGKGASIVRMVDYILGDETFRRGLTVTRPRQFILFICFFFVKF
jgi:aminopeptidase N